MTQKNKKWIRPLSQYALGSTMILWLPVVFTLGVMIPSAISSEWYMSYLHGELGIVENVQVLVLLAAIVIGLIVLASARNLTRGLFIWTLLIVIGLVYILGEELSWGQHFFGWSTPENWSAINKQEETNLHNVSTLFNNKPRALLEIIFFLLLVSYFVKPGFLPKMPEKFTWLVPTRDLMPTLILVILAKLPQKLIENLGMHLGNIGKIRYSEVHEVFLYFAFVLYLLALRQRFNNKAAFEQQMLKD